MSTLTITTPEHVEITLEPAGAGSRFLAVLIDFVITAGMCSILAAITSAFVPRAIGTAIVITAWFAIPLAWHMLWETKGNGRTPGKRALSLRVVDARGLPLSLHQALVRNIVRVIDFAPAFYGVAAVTTVVDPLRRRFGDIVADTLVIREPKPVTYRAELAGERRYNTLRTPRVMRLIRHRISLEERELLLAICMRADRMKPDARYDLMEEVAAAYRERLDVEDESTSGENFVRDLTSVLFAKRV